MFSGHWCGVLVNMAEEKYHLDKEKHRSMPVVVTGHLFLFFWPMLTSYWCYDQPAVSWNQRWERFLLSCLYLLMYRISMKLVEKNKEKIYCIYSIRTNLVFILDAKENISNIRASLKCFLCLLCYYYFLLEPFNFIEDFSTDFLPFLPCPPVFIWNSLLSV